MDAVGLDATYGAYLDQIPGVTLATVNLMSLFGLHRRLRGAIVGHLALFEMTSSVPEPALRQRPAAARLRRGRVPVLRRARRRRRGARERRGGRPRRRARPAGPAPGRRHPVGRPRAAGDRRPLGAAHAAAWERRRVSLRPARLCADATAARPCSAPLGARKRITLCVPSQNGRSRDLPQRHSATVVSRPPTSISSPSWSTSLKAPRTSSGPSRYGVITVSESAISLRSPPESASDGNAVDQRCSASRRSLPSERRLRAWTSGSVIEFKRKSGSGGHPRVRPS